MFENDKSIKSVAEAYRRMVEAAGKTMILNHPDEVSGTTVFADKTACIGRRVAAAGWP